MTRSELRARARDILRSLLWRHGPRTLPGTAQRHQAGEQAQAKQRILDLAEAGRTPIADTTQAVPDRWRRRGQ